MKKRKREKLIDLTQRIDDNVLFNSLKHYGFWGITLELFSCCLNERLQLTPMLQSSCMNVFSGVDPRTAAVSFCSIFLPYTVLVDSA